jgi:hypothetical protein
MLDMKTEDKPRGRAWRAWTGTYEVICVDPPFAICAIPEKAIRFEESLLVVDSAVRKNPTVLLSVPKIEEYMGCRIEDDDERVRELACARLREIPQGRFTPEERKKIFPWERAARLFYLSRIMAGELTTYVRDPEAGDILQLSTIGWLEEYENLCFSPPGEEGCVPPHHESLIRGEHQPIFLWRHEFDEWLEKTFGTQKRRGRKPGSGSMETADEPFLVEMHRLIESGSATSPDDAARQVAKGARGASVESIQTRLAKRYRKKFASERN